MERRRIVGDQTEPLFFAQPGDFREWLSQYHQKVDEQWVGFYKKATGKPSITWPESVDQALCFGWIDGLRKSIDEEAYMIRFTPRRPDSNWSQKNLKRMPELIAAGLVAPAGMAIYEARDKKKFRLASYEKEKVTLSPDLQATLESHPEAWDFFQSLAPSYQRATLHYIMSAKLPATRKRRLELAIDRAKAGECIPQIAGPKSRNPKK